MVMQSLAATDLNVRTKSFALRFTVGADGRLYQNVIGAAGNGEPSSAREAYPQAGGDGRWEPALQVAHADGKASTPLRFVDWSRTNDAAGREWVRIQLRDSAHPLDVTLCFCADRERDVLEQWTEIVHQEPGPIVLERMASSGLLFSTNALLTHFSGDWASEMLVPITEPLTPGIKILDSKIGVRATQHTAASFILALDGAPKEDSGRVVAGTLAWSGNFQFAFDDNAETVCAMCGLNPFASAYHLDPGETFSTPHMLWAWSANGLGELSRKLHRWARDFGIRDGHSPRAVLLNNWEATGCDFDFNRIAGLFAPAQEIGTELFLLDDGWFGNKFPRLDDHAGLGDWQPNRQRLPNGLGPLAAEAIQRGLRFGIWLEPEMVNPKSELFEQHPDWVIAQPHRELELQRNQLVLDLTRPAVQQFEWDAIRGVLATPGITYAKWDCNRQLTQPGSSYLSPERQSQLWIDYVQALYGLMDKTARTFPKTELMLCASGGGRVDYGALKYFHEFWPSDNTDPVARVLMQWDYSYFFPPMALASHVTRWGNRPMHFACSVAMSARFGMDLDLTKLSREEKAICAGAIRAYKGIRDVTQLGDLYRLEDPHEGFRGAIGYVSEDRSRAVVFAFQLHDGSQAAVHPQGLDPEKKYRVCELNPAPGRAPLPQENQVFSGAKLMRDGIAPSCSHALEACVIELGGAAR